MLKPCLLKEGIHDLGLHTGVQFGSRPPDWTQNGNHAEHDMVAHFGCDDDRGLSDVVFIIVVFFFVGSATRPISEHSSVYLQRRQFTAILIRTMQSPKPRC